KAFCHIFCVCRTKNPPKRGLGDHNIAYNNSTPNGVHASVLRPPSWRRSPTGAPKNHAVFRFHTSPIAAPLARRRFVTFFVPIEQKIRQNDPWTTITLPTIIAPLTGCMPLGLAHQAGAGPTGAPKNHAVFRFHTSPIAAPLARRRFVTFFVPIEQKIRQNDPWTTITLPTIIAPLTGCMPLGFVHQAGAGPTGAPKNHAVFRFHTSPIAAPLARIRYITFL